MRASKLGAFEAVFRSVVGRAHRTGEPLALLLVRLDDLPQLERDLGRAAVDACVAHVTREVRSVLCEAGRLYAGQAGEHCFLIGGDRATRASDLARAVTERLASSPPLHHGLPLRPAISVGLATLSAGHSLDDLLSLAVIARTRVVAPRPQAIRAASPLSR